MIRPQDTFDLTLTGVRVSDAGEYYCRAENLVGRRDSDVARLSVHIAPFLLSDPVDLTARAGDDVTLECRAGGEPRPRFTWSREDGGVVAGARGPTLHLPRVLSEDEGVYYCR